MTLIGVMNNTKWDELRLAMYALGDQRPRFQVKSRDFPSLGPWDGEWFYHFRDGGYDDIEWVDLRIESTDQRQIVRASLKRICLPGVETDDGFRIFGWVKAGAPVAYIS